MRWLVMGWLWGWVWFWLHCSHLERAWPFWVMKYARLRISWWLFGKLCFSISVRLSWFVILVNSLFGPWVFVVAVICGLVVVCCWVLFFLVVVGVMFPVFGSIFPMQVCLFRGCFLFLSQ